MAREVMEESSPDAATSGRSRHVGFCDNEKSEIEKKAKRARETETETETERDRDRDRDRDREGERKKGKEKERLRENASEKNALHNNDVQ